MTDWNTPEEPDYDGLVDDLLQNAFTFKRVSGGARVFLDGTENDRIHSVAARNGFTVHQVDTTGGAHDAQVSVRRKGGARNAEDAEEYNHRVDE